MLGLSLANRARDLSAALRGRGLPPTPAVGAWGYALLRAAGPLRRRAARWLSGCHPAGPMLLARELAGPPRPPPGADAQDYATGWLVGGAIVAFLLHVHEQARARGLGQVFFAAREGLVLLRVYRLLGDMPAGRYLLVSRAATLPASRPGPERMALLRYLRRCGFCAHREVALVDVGWRGSIQDHLCAALAGEPDAPRIHGLYLALRREATGTRQGARHGFLASGQPGDLLGQDLFRHGALLEMVLSAGHGTTAGYRESRLAPGTAVPVLAGHPIEQAQFSRHFRWAQQGILDFARRFAACRDQLPFPAAALRHGALVELLRHVRYPSAAEARAALDYAHVDAGRVTTFARTRDALVRHPWSEGVVRRSRVPLGNFFYDLYYSVASV